MREGRVLILVWLSVSRGWSIIEYDNFVYAEYRQSSGNGAGKIGFLIMAFSTMQLLVQGTFALQVETNFAIMLPGSATLNVLCRGPFGTNKADGFVVSGVVFVFEAPASSENFLFCALISQSVSLDYVLTNLGLRHPGFR